MVNANLTGFAVNNDQVELAYSEAEKLRTRFDPTIVFVDIEAAIGFKYSKEKLTIKLSALNTVVLVVMLDMGTDIWATPETNST